MGQWESIDSSRTGIWIHRPFPQDFVAASCVKNAVSQCENHGEEKTEVGTYRERANFEGIESGDREIEGIRRESVPFNMVPTSWEVGRQGQPQISYTSDMLVQRKCKDGATGWRKDGRQEEEGLIG